MNIQLTQRAKQVDRRPMTWLEKIYLWNIAKGMLITLSHFFKRKQRSNTLSKKEVFQKYSAACRY